MANQKVILCGSHETLLRALRNGSVPVEQIPFATFFSGSVGLQDVGMIFLLHAPPANDCLATVRKCKRENPGIPVVVATSDYSGPTTRLLLKSGAEDVLGLPVNDDDVLACYEAYLPGFKLKPSRPVRKRNSSTTGKILLAAVTPGMVAAGVDFAQLPAVTPPISLPQPAQNDEQAYRGLQLSFFGNFSVHFNGRRIHLTNQAKYLFAYLAYHYPRALSRDHLARAFWPDKCENMPEFARKSLNVELTHIRKAFRNQAGVEQDFLVFEKNAYRLKLERPPVSDVLVFKELQQKIQENLRRGQEVPDTLFRETIQTYTGNFLDDFPADMFNWVEVERQHLSAVFEQTADLYSAQLYAQKDYWKAVAVCNEILSRDARMEVIHRRAMQCYASLGMAHKVEAQYTLCCKMMDQEFQSRPSPETVRLHEQIKGIES